MTAQRWDDDDRLLKDLADALSSPGTVSERILESARAAYTWRTVDAELEVASLIFDSHSDDAEAEEMLVRDMSPDAPITLVFAAGELSVEFEITSAGLVGQLVPPQPGTITLSTPNGQLTEARADDAGCFLLPPPPPGPVRLTCRTSEASVVTDWVTV
jgi:hypothetical protein